MASKKKPAKSKKDDDKEKKKKKTTKKKVAKKPAKKKKTNPTKAKAPRAQKKSSTAKKKTPKTVKKNIEQAVDSIPGLIIEHTAWEPTPPKPPAPPKKKKAPPHYQEPRHATVLTWVGAGTIALCILGLWIWHARTLVTDAIATPSEEIELLSNARADFTSIFDILGETEEDTTATDEPAADVPAPEETEATIKETLAGLIPQLPAATTTASSTSPLPTDQPADEE